MTNEEAINELLQCYSLYSPFKTAKKTNEAIRMAIEALKQPDVPDINVGDTISRQAAIDVLYGITTYKNSIPIDSAVFNIKKLPSAQPTIIHCKDCKYSTDVYGDGECYCKRPSRELVWIGKRWDFFCAAAKKMEVSE